MEKVKKRNGTIVSYDSEKIANCIRKACKDVKDTITKDELMQIVLEIEERLSGIKVPGVERIQDTVESVLMKTKHEKAAKAYIIYRSEHAKIRDTQQTLIDKMMEITFKTGEESDYKRSNANIPSDTTMGSMLIYGTTVSNYFNDNYVYPKKYIAADRKGLIHIHDKDFSMLTWNCAQQDLQRLLKGGFKIGDSYIREPQGIRSYASLACIALQSSQNDMFGGQSISNFDYTMAIGVRKTFRKEFLKAMKEFLIFSDVQDDSIESIITELKDGKDKYHILDNTILPSYKNETKLPAIVSILEKHNISSAKHIVKKAYDTACARTEDETFQAMESVIFNFNTMHCLPASEKIWVLNTNTDYVETISMEELAKNFETTRYKVISLQRKNGHVEFKPITAIKKLDNYRKLVTITDGFGNKVTTTDNHKIMYLNDAGKIDETTADKVPHVLVPTTMRHPKVKDDIYIGKYMSDEIERSLQYDYSKTHVAVTEDFARFIGYYTSIGKIINNDLIFKANKKVLNSTSIIELVQRLIGKDIPYTIDSLYQITFKLPEVWSKMLIDRFGDDKKKIASEVLFSANECQTALVEAFIEDDDLINKDDDLASQQIYLLLMTSIHEPSRQDIKLRKTFRAVKIKSKEESNSGDEYVYDISVADNETFLTKDCIFVHNSRAGQL